MLCEASDNLRFIDRTLRTGLRHLKVGCLLAVNGFIDRTLRTGLRPKSGWDGVNGNSFIDRTLRTGLRHLVVVLDACLTPGFIDRTLRTGLGQQTGVPKCCICALLTGLYGRGRL